MVMPVQQFAIPSFQQANPIMSGLQQAQGISAQAIQNALQQRYGAQQKAAQIGLQRAQMQKALATAQGAGQAGFPPAVKILHAYQVEYAKDPNSPATKYLALAARKAIASPAGTQITTGAKGGTTIQMGGSAPAPSVPGITAPIQAHHIAAALQGAAPGAIPAGAAPTATQPGAPAQALGALIQAPVAQVAQQQDITQPQQPQIPTQESQLFAPQETLAQQQDAKQFGTDLSTTTQDASTVTSKGIPALIRMKTDIARARKLGLLNPAGGHISPYTKAGRDLQIDIAKQVGQIMANVKGLRNVKEFNALIPAAGRLTDYPENLDKIVNNAFEDATIARTKSDFYTNYKKVSGANATASDANSIWMKMGTPEGISQVDPKYLNFKVSGSNRTLRDYVNAIHKHKQYQKLRHIPISSVISEDLYGGQ